jgi:hypothetical protein
MGSGPGKPGRAEFEGAPPRAADAGEVGEIVRFYVGIRCPDFTSSFHVMGEISDSLANPGGRPANNTRGLSAQS